MKDFITMKKKAIFGGLLAVLTMSAAMGSKMILVSDTCKRCEITDTSYKCGLCGTGMSIKQEWGDKTMKWMKCTFTCTNSKCKHICVYKYNI